MTNENYSLKLKNAFLLVAMLGLMFIQAYSSVQLARERRTNNVLRARLIMKAANMEVLADSYNAYKKAHR